MQGQPRVPLVRRVPMEGGNACAPPPTHPGAAPKVLRMEKSKRGQSAERGLAKINS